MKFFAVTLRATYGMRKNNKNRNVKKKKKNYIMYNIGNTIF